MRSYLKMAGAAALVAGGLGLASAAQAAPAAPTGLAGQGLIEHVAQGCGPGFHRGWNGVCRPNFGPRRPFVERCFVRRTPWGVRRVCR